MADNFLEKQYEEWKNGRPSVRRSTPSLESLIRKLGDTGTADPSYQVKQAQLDAMVRAASGLGNKSEFRTDEASATVIVRCQDKVMLGESLLAMKLKAAELKLQAEVSAEHYDTITLKISKAL